MSFEIVKNRDSYNNCAIITNSLYDINFDELYDLNVDTIRLSSFNGWIPEKLDRLLQYQGIKGVEINTFEKIDLSPLYELQELESLELDCIPLKNFNLSNFKKLKSLFFKDNSKFNGYSSCSNLRYLNIINFKEISFEGIANLNKLEEVLVSSRKLETLEGIDVADNLKYLEMSGCSKLKEIEKISNLNNLEELSITSCYKLHEIPLLPSSIKRVIIENCGKIKDCQFLAKAYNLRAFFFIGDGTFVNGDLSILDNLKLDEIVIPNKKHYNRKFSF